MRLTRILGIWGMLGLLMFFNGALRVVALKPLFGPEAGEVLSALLGVVIVLGASRPFLLEERPMPTGGVLRVSLIWFALTVITESVLAIVSGQTWSAILLAYVPWTGSLWPMVLVAVIAAPLVWLPRREDPEEHVVR
jgi:hypothetical protein